VTSNFERPDLGRIAGTRAEKRLKVLHYFPSFWYQPQIYLEKLRFDPFFP